jgi:DNA replication protein DnaC
MPDCLKCQRESLLQGYGEELDPWCSYCKAKFPKDEYRAAYSEYVRQHPSHYLSLMGVPDRFLRCRLENFEGKSSHQRRVLAAVSSWLNDDSGLFLCGPCGTGKTHLSVSVLLRMKQKRMDGRFVSVPELLTECRDSFRGDEGLDAVLSKYSDCDCLVLDDLGAENSTPFARETLGNLIDRAYRNEQYLVVTSNLDLKALSQKLGERTVDRIKEMCLPVKFEGTSYRQLILTARMAKRQQAPDVVPATLEVAS